MNAIAILKEWLREHGFDGLAGDECGCGIDDLVPCDMGAQCVPAYKRICPSNVKDRACHDPYADVLYSDKKQGADPCADCPMRED